jgi:hypothetical protein
LNGINNFFYIFAYIFCFQSLIYITLLNINLFSFSERIFLGCEELYDK